MTKPIQGLLAVIRREIERISKQPIYLFASVGAPLLVACLLLYMMGGGLPTSLPVAVVDEDHSATSRSLIRSLDAFQGSEVVLHAQSMNDALEAMRRGEVYGILHIPKNLQADAGAARQPKLHYYTNSAYMMAGSFVFKDIKMLGELASAGVGLQTGRAQGKHAEEIIGEIQPIVVRSEVMSNPWINYSAYLTTIILPGILQLMIFFLTTYSIGIEIKQGSAREWLQTAGGSMPMALLGKLLPQTVLFLATGFSIQAILFGWMGYPLQSGWLPMLGAMVSLVLAAQAMGAFFISLMPILRMGMSISSLLGMLSFTMSGMSIPISSMIPALQALAYIFPLRYYYQISISQALLGAPLSEALPHYIGLLVFLILPILFLGRLKHYLEHVDYIP